MYMSLHCERKPEYLKGAHTDTVRSCKPHNRKARFLLYGDSDHNRTTVSFLAELKFFTSKTKCPWT